MFAILWQRSAKCSLRLCEIERRGSDNVLRQQINMDRMIAVLKLQFEMFSLACDKSVDLMC